MDQLRKDQRLLVDMKYLVLDDPYLRSLLKLQRWKRTIEVKPSKEEAKGNGEGCEEDSEQSSGENIDTAEVF